MVYNAEELTSNLQALLSIHKKAIGVLNSAKKKDNHEIAKVVDISHTTISTILNQAKKFGYVEKKEGKWIKTKEVKGINLYRMAKAKFTNSLNPDKGFSKKGVKIKNPFEPLIYYKEATDMKECYKIIFSLENTLRDFIRSVFKNEVNWLDKRLDDDIKKYIEKAKNEPYYAHPRKKDDLDYATLGHIFQIIISNKNWGDFLPRIREKSKNEFKATFKKILPSRNAVAHCIHLNKTNRDLIESRAIEISMMFKLN